MIQNDKKRQLNASPHSQPKSVSHQMFSILKNKSGASSFTDQRLYDKTKSVVIVLNEALNKIRLYIL
jgi:hypothetical protein